MTAKNSPRKAATGRKFILKRVFDAPRPLVFAAWTEPQYLQKWSAPRGFTIPVSQGDLQPGGKWRACMVSPQGEKMWLSGVYRDVIPNELLVFTHAWEDETGARGPETIVTVRFADQDGKTEVTLEQGPFDSAGSRDGHQGGWSECLDRLVEHLAAVQRKRRAPR
jgi:uncharacterized protein YndB with AHSA1/START domain